MAGQEIREFKYFDTDLNKSLLWSTLEADKLWVLAENRRLGRVVKGHQSSRLFFLFQKEKRHGWLLISMVKIWIFIYDIL